MEMANKVVSLRLKEEILEDIEKTKLEHEETTDYIRRAILERIDKDKKENELYEIRKRKLEES